jgi:hypothetical protein
MANGADGACAPLDNFTDDQLLARLGKARDLRQRFIDQSPEACSPYEQHAAHEVSGYLLIIANEAVHEINIRSLPAEIKTLGEELSALEEPPSASPPHSEESYEHKRERWRLSFFINQKELSLAESRKSICGLRKKLAAISSQEINSYMDVVGISKLEPLRPTMPELCAGANPLTKETKVAGKAFRRFAAEWWSIQRKNYGSDRVPVEEFKEFAKECNKRRFKPNSAILPGTVWKQVKRWNKEHKNDQVDTFTDMIERFSMKRGSGDPYTLGPLRTFLWTNLNRLSKDQLS